jgi:hypothetical protein
VPSPKAKPRGRPPSGSAKRDDVEVVKGEVENVEQRRPKARTRSVTRTPKKKAPKKKRQRKKAQRKKKITNLKADQNQ